MGVSPAEIQRFYESNWNRKIALSNPEYYAWQFINNPLNPGEDECAVALYDGKLCGVMGANSRYFYRGGERVLGGELTTWIVSEDMRGKGVGPKILGFLVDKYDVLIGMGITREALPIYLRQGFRFLRSIPRYLRVMDYAAIAEYAAADALGVKLAESRKAPIISSETIVSSLDAGSLNEVFLEFARRYQLFSRENADFRWRYEDHPVYDYESRLLTVKQSGKRAVIVTRSQDLPNGQKMLRVIDVFGDDEAIVPVLAYLDARCLEEGYAIADFFCTSSRITSKFVANGWFSVLDEECFQFPHLFEPIELRVPATTSLIYWARQDLDRLVDLSTVYITKEDADLDRPVSVEG